MIGGDGSTTTHSEPGLGTFTITHTYAKASSSTGYIIAIRGSDGAGKTAELETMTIISNPNSRQAQQVARANAGLNPGILARLKKWLWLAWPAYVIVALMAISFWLGEREEYKKITSRIIRRRRK